MNLYQKDGRMTTESFYYTYIQFTAATSVAKTNLQT